MKVRVTAGEPPLWTVWPGYWLECFRLLQGTETLAPDGPQEEEGREKDVNIGLYHRLHHGV